MLALRKSRDCHNWLSFGDDIENEVCVIRIFDAVIAQIMVIGYLFKDVAHIHCAEFVDGVDVLFHIVRL